MLSEATVDTCPRCRGLWVDWFDGELVAVVKETAPLSTRPASDLDTHRAVCPRCSQRLVSETVSGAILLLRCTDCMGCFVPRASFTALLGLDHPACVVAEAPKAGAFKRLLAAIRSLLLP